MGPPAAGAVPAIVEALQDRDPAVRSWLLRALRAIGEDAASAVPALIALLDDADQMVRVGALSVLAAIGPKASAALPKLQAMARDTKYDQHTRLSAEYAAKRIQGRQPGFPRL